MIPFQLSHCSDAVLRIEALGLDHIPGGVRHVVQAAVGQHAVTSISNSLILEAASHNQLANQFSSAGRDDAVCAAVVVNGQLAAIGVTAGPCRRGYNVTNRASRSNATSAAPLPEASFSGREYRLAQSVAIICVRAGEWRSAPPAATTPWDATRDITS